jgi:uracil-DNA glycosylase
MNKQELLDQIKADIVKDNVCPDLALNATNLVFGDGNPNADIMFIGEAPGRQEDEQGLPFVGASGKFLSEMLNSIHLKREQVYITNIVKYRPPNNRDPEPTEKTDFWPYLLKQIQVINPLIVVTLGRHPMTMFTPKAKISEVHGQPIRIRISNFESGISSENKDGTSLVILPLYHPAAALYNGSMRAILQQDFSQIPELLTLIRKGN